MSEHAFLALMLGFAIFETLALAALIGYFLYRVDRKSDRLLSNGEQLEGMIAATYLEARRALRQGR
jgi:hypothetical protein